MAGLQMFQHDAAIIQQLAAEELKNAQINFLHSSHSVRHRSLCSYVLSSWNGRIKFCRKGDALTEGS